VYPNAYCNITATTIQSNLSNTEWYMMKHRLRPVLWILTGQFREHLTETYNEPRAKKRCRGRWLKLVEVGFQFFVSPFSLWLFFSPPPWKPNEASASMVATVLVFVNLSSSWYTAHSMLNTIQCINQSNGCNIRASLI
jgi:hypothetical protein